MWSKLAALEERCTDGLILVDKSWRCVHMNHTAAELLDADVTDALNRTVWDVFRKAIDESTCAQWQRACLECLPANLGEFRAPQGRYVACRCWPAGDAALLSMVDVTDWGGALRAAAHERQRMESFLTVLAHELRNPLGTLCQGVAALRAADADASHEIDRRAVLERMERQLKYFVTVVDDLLDVSRVVRGRVHIRKELVEIDDVVDEAFEIVGGMPGAKGVRMHAEVPMQAAVYADRVRLQQVLMNLLKNAVTATDSGGDVFVSVREADAFVEIEVRDSGCGIEPERLERLFEPAYEYSVGEGQGLGVGLGVVKRLVELHGGQVTAHSEGHARGATFIVRFPSASHSAPGVQEEL